MLYKGSESHYWYSKGPDNDKHGNKNWHKILSIVEKEWIIT